MIKPRPLRLRWDAETGWLVDVPVTLTQSQLSRIIQWALPKQIDRYRALPLGDRKDQLGQAIQALRRGELQQRILENNDGVAVPFASTERQTTRSYFHG
jgi:hypothetical protein